MARNTRWQLYKFKYKWMLFQEYDIGIWQQGKKRRFCFAFGLDF